MAKKVGIIAHVDHGKTSLAATLALLLQKPSPRNWSEDFEHENGNYACVCHSCDHTFYGHKRRVACKVCANSKRDS